MSDDPVDQASGLGPRASVEGDQASEKTDTAPAPGADAIPVSDPASQELAAETSEPSEARGPRPEASEKTDTAPAPASDSAPLTDPASEELAAETSERSEARGPRPEASGEVERELKRLSRRGFLTAGVAAAAGYGTWKWLTTRQRIDGLQWPLRRVLQLNESVAESYFGTARLTPTFPPSRIKRPARLNGNLGLDPRFDPAAWRLLVEGAEGPVTLSLDDIKALPRHDQITEFRCIEGWSMIVKWTGVRLADLMARFPPPERVNYIAMETPDRGYYVGLDMQSAMHPQTLLAYALNDELLSMPHGAPLRLAIPVKYGIKNIKRIGVIRYTNVRPADFWAEQGYDWYAGH